MVENRTDNPLTLKLGREELIIRRRYEVVSIINDFFIAIWFLVGSILFLFPEYEKAAIWLFIIGSFQFLTGFFLYRQFLVRLEITLSP